MTSEHIAFVICVALKMIPVTSCIVGAVFLIYKGMGGWGWLIFLAIVLGYSNIKIGS